MNTLLLFIQLLSSLQHHKIDYIDYQRSISFIKIAVLNKEYNKALVNFEDSIYKKYDFIYAQDIFMATQLAVLLCDRDLSFRYLDKCMLQGIPFIVLKNDRIIGKLMTPSEWNMYSEKYDELHDSYLSRINLGLKNEIDSMFALDTPATHKLNHSGFPSQILAFVRWRHIVNKNFKRLNKITREYGYPGERLIGISNLNDLDSISLTKKKIGINAGLGQFNVLNMYLHYYSSKKKDINAELYSSLVEGNIPASSYASINDFIAKYGAKRYRRNFYNEWHINHKIDPEEVNRRRMAVGLYPFELKNRLIEDFKSSNRKSNEQQYIYNAFTR